MKQLCDKARMLISCLPVSREWGFDDYAVLTHAFLESAWGMKPVGEYNFWGLKVPKRTPWKGKRVRIITSEEERWLSSRDMGRLRRKYGEERVISIKLDRERDVWTVVLRDTFVDFPTVEQAMLYYLYFIRRNYGDVYMHRADPSTYFEKLVDSVKDFPTDSDLKFATDQLYVQKLLSLYDEIRKHPEIRRLVAEVA